MYKTDECVKNGEHKSFQQMPKTDTLLLMLKWQNPLAAEGITVHWEQRRNYCDVVVKSDSDTEDCLTIDSQRRFLRTTMSAIKSCFCA